MKKTTFLKTFLVAVGLLMGTSAWADPNYMTTMTGLLGLSDNSAAAWTYYSKTVTLKAGETYTYTFQNYTKGSSATAESETWIAEIRENTTNYCLDARGDGGGWKWEPSSDNLSYNYTGKAWNEGGRSLSDFMTAYNNVTVTLTISCSNDGTEVTIARTSTLNGDTDFSGTWTCSGFVGNDKTINLIAEASHLNITKVVYTPATGDVVNYELKNVDLSQFDTYFSGSYSDGVATFTNSGSSKVWAKLSLSSYFSGITGTITNVNMKFTENMNDGGRMTIGIYGNDKASWATNAWQDTDDAVSTWGLTGSSYATRIYYGSTYVTGVTLNSAAEIEVDMDVINKKFTLIQGGTTKVNNQNYCDDAVLLPQYLALYSWSPTNTTTLTNVTMEVVYVEASYYTATFTENNSLSPTVTIYSDAGRTSSVANGTLVDGTTYYYRAVLTGYNNYEGSFTVSGANPSVSFTMTALPRYTFTVNAINSANSAVIQALYTDDDSYDGKTHDVYFPKYLTGVGNIVTFSKDNTTYYQQYTSASADATKTVSYTAYDGVAYFFEGESYASLGTKESNGNYSNGRAGRGLTSTMNIATIPATGNYDITYAVCSSNVGTGKETQFSFYKNNSENIVVDVTDLNHSVNAVKTTGTQTVNNKAFAAGDILQFYAKEGKVILDYVLVELKTVPATITDAGWSTFASPYALDLSSMTASTGTVEAYYASDASGSTVTLSETTATVPAGEGIMLKGTAGATITIPVAASGSAISGNKLKGQTTTGTVDASNKAGNGIYHYVFGYSKTDASIYGFYNLGADTEVAAGKAYLETTTALTAGARIAIVFDDNDATAISEAKSQLPTANSQFFDLQGRRVAQPTKGLYIVNGKKVIVK